ncbi:MAG TPA: ArsR family transcriptional regulator [candidate division Zixibacteria bacterium]|nr:ArsR family transcriptional regulator [candidate division Zixibacteria bacterium]
MDIEIIEAKASVFKALGHPSRLAMVEKLAEGECCVCDLVDLVGADFSTVSKHLAVLKDNGIVDFERNGQRMFYRLKVPCLLRFIDCVEAVIKNTSRSETELAECSNEMSVR